MYIKHKGILTVIALKDVLNYNENTGQFTWIKRPCSQAIVGEIAGWKTEYGYWRISLFHKRYAAHRLAWFYVYGEWPKKQLDHIDGNRSNNRIDNLRDAAQFDNSQNRYKPSKNNKSGFLGVHFNKYSKKWVAMIMINGKSHFLGGFKSPEMASEAYLSAKTTLHPFSNHLTNLQSQWLPTEAKRS